MMIRLLSSVAGTALIASVSFAQAAEPRVLGEVQMDSVTAGYTINVTGPGNYTMTLAVAESGTRRLAKNSRYFWSCYF